MPKPKFIDPVELKNRVKAGLEKRRKDGTLVVLDDRARPDPRGAHFSKKQRKRYVLLCEGAIAFMAQRHWDDYVDAIRELAQLMAAANFSRPVFQHTIAHIERVACEIADHPFLRDEAQLALRKAKARRIIIPGARPGLAERNPQNDPEKIASADTPFRASGKRKNSH